MTPLMGCLILGLGYTRGLGLLYLDFEHLGKPWNWSLRPTLGYYDVREGGLSTRVSEQAYTSLVVSVGQSFSINIVKITIHQLHSTAMLIEQLFLLSPTYLPPEKKNPPTHPISPLPLISCWLIKTPQKSPARKRSWPQLLSHPFSIRHQGR